jgi:hypothetical protein
MAMAAPFDQRSTPPQVVPRSWRSRVWEFVTLHLFFFLPVRLPELEPGTTDNETLETALASVEQEIALLDDEALDYTLSALKDELSRVIADIAGVRSRAGQLLASTGFIAVLGSIGSSLPSSRAVLIIAYVVAALAVYALIGTLYLASQAQRVRHWEETRMEPVTAGAHHLKELDASKLYRTCRKLSIRLERPAGYLADAQWFFFATVVLIITLVLLRI